MVVQIFQGLPVTGLEPRYEVVFCDMIKRIADEPGFLESKGKEFNCGTPLP